MDTNNYFTTSTNDLSSANLRPLAEHIFPRIFRTDFTQPGFALIRFAGPLDSHQLRRAMVDLKELLSDLHQKCFGSALAYLSLGRFDQQVTTKFHLDGSPERAMLMLGYEPSKVASHIALADYSRAAHALGMTPQQFLDDYNPMFARGQKELAPYVTPLQQFDPSAAQILCINNSSQPYLPGSPNQLGVMHQAAIPQPRTDKQRVVNSTMIGIAGANQPALDVEHFLTTAGVAEKY